MTINVFLPFIPFFLNFISPGHSYELPISSNSHHTMEREKSMKIFHNKQEEKLFRKEFIILRNQTYSYSCRTVETSCIDKAGECKRHCYHIRGNLKHIEHKN